jgi:hypothetical protein
MRGWTLCTVALTISCSGGADRQLGDTCSKSSQCASGRCDELVCKAAEPGELGALPHRRLFTRHSCRWGALLR